MLYLVDAQLPRQLVLGLQKNGYEALHTLDSPDQNETEDDTIIAYAAVNAPCVVITKDRDFPEQRLLRGEPELLLWITAGNITNRELFGLFRRSFAELHERFSKGAKFIELTAEEFLIHE